MVAKYVASLSYGKDSIAMLHVICDVLKKPLDRIITADVWATDDIPAELPPMVEFKQYADEEIKRRWGISVEHFTAAAKDGSKQTYEKVFHTVCMKKDSPRYGLIYGFPLIKGPWCNGMLKMAALKIANKSAEGAVSYIGIAEDEAERVARHSVRPLVELPLVEAGWAEKDCYQWCEENGLLSPTYKTNNRDGCWFCHNQGINPLRNLRSNYPDLWALLLKWDDETPRNHKFKPYETVHDYERRFKMEDEGYFLVNQPFRWSCLDCAQMNIFQFVKKPQENAV